MADHDGLGPGVELVKFVLKGSQGDELGALDAGSLVLPRLPDVEQHGLLAPSELLYELARRQVLVAEILQTRDTRYSPWS